MKHLSPYAALRLRRWLHGHDDHELADFGGSTRRRDAMFALVDELERGPVDWHPVCDEHRLRMTPEECAGAFTYADATIRCAKCASKHALSALVSWLSGEAIPERCPFCVDGRIPERRNATKLVTCRVCDGRGMAA